MSRVFRKFRLKQIGGKPSRKYLAYAIGEIMLIVIGLLLAIQINNFQEGIKNDKKRDNYYRLLITDLESDIQQIEKVKESISEQLKLIENFESRLNLDEGSKEEIVAIAKNEFNPNLPNFVRYQLGTIETLKATGDLSLIEGDILEGIGELQALQSEQIYYLDAGLKARASILEKYMTHFPIKKGVIHQGELFNLFWNAQEVKEIALQLNALLTMEKGMLSNASNYYDKILIRTRKIIDSIKDKT